MYRWVAPSCTHSTQSPVCDNKFRQECATVSRIHRTAPHPNTVFLRSEGKGNPKAGMIDMFLIADNFNYSEVLDVGVNFLMSVCIY